MKKFKTFPFVMTILSALYFISVAVQEDFKYDVDTVGGDPGGKFLPLIMAGFLTLGFLYITLKERPDGNKMEKDTRNLFLATFGLCVTYVLLLKPIGFVLMTIVLLFSVLYLFTTIGEKRSWKEGLISGGITAASTVAVYYLMRYLTKTMLRMGRNGSLPAVFGKTTTTAIVCLVLLTAVTVVLSLTVCKSLKAKGKKTISSTCIITFAVVLFLYVVFKQFFQVQLATGLINY